MRKLCTLFLLPVMLSAASINIYNDSIYRLTATVFAADGTNVGTMEIPPRNQMKWQDSDLGGKSNFSQSPYTVIFKCPSGSDYGIWNRVASGATVTASSAQGTRICKPKEPEQTPAGDEEGTTYPDPTPDTDTKEDKYEFQPVR